MSGITTKVDIHPLCPDDSLRVNNDEAHLGNTGHAAHGLAGFGQEIILAGYLQVFIIEDRQRRATQLPYLGRLSRRVAVDGVDIGFGL